MQKAKEILKKLIQSGHSAYIVGGAVRDSVIGAKMNDVDIATSASPYEVMTLFEKVVPSGISFGTVTVMMDNEGYEVTTFRKDGRYEDGRRPVSVSYSDSILEDLARRDFTINAMAMDIDGNIIDPFSGQEDFKREILRTVGDAKERFSEDALRMLRAARFAARFDLVLDQDIVHASKNMGKSTQLLSGERIFQELVKMLQHGSRGIELLQEMDILRHVLPEVHSMVKVGQNHPHHHLDVFAHTLATIDASPEEGLIRLAMLFHDAGKPFVKSSDGTIDRFHGHADVSQELAIKALKRLKASRKVTDTVAQLVLLHDSEVALTMKSVRKLRGKLTEASIQDWIAVRRADISGQHPDTRSEKIARLNQIEKLSETPESTPFGVKDLAINGHDLIAIGLSGPQIGQTLSRLLNAVMSDPSLNNKQVLLSMI